MPLPFLLHPLRLGAILVGQSAGERLGLLVRLALAPVGFFSLSGESSGEARVLLLLPYALLARGLLGADPGQPLRLDLGPLPLLLFPSPLLLRISAALFLLLTLAPLLLDAAATLLLFRRATTGFVLLTPHPLGFFGRPSSRSLLFLLPRPLALRLLRFSSLAL
ncbi:hypothetical protein JCM8097_006007 [Rhodosporidiobolus ruineniae]